jgi:hypothetical protein
MERGGDQQGLCPFSNLRRLTMTSITPTIRRMTFEEAQQLRLHSRGMAFEHNGNTYNLNAGTSDKIHVFTESICIYVLIINKSLGYIGLDAYMPKEPDPINSVFLHSEQQIADCLGRRWQQLSPRTIAQRLVEYLI